MHAVVMCAAVLFLLGLLTTVLRRSLLFCAAGFFVSFIGTTLLFVASERAVDVAPSGFGSANGLIVVVLGASLLLLTSTIALVVYRHRAMVNLDELRELRG
jgi:NADH:ubiquinone oxidoreductase subunit K